MAIPCPLCSHPVDSKAHTCTNCGVDLAIAAVLAERRVYLPESYSREGFPEGIHIAPEILVPRLGDYLLEKGVLQPEELERALRYQREKTRAGHPLLLGQALRELELVDSETLDQAVTEQILQLQTALSQSNQQLEQRVEERTRELQQAVQKLTELSQLKSNFVANISHELRTPLTHIKGYLDLLADNGLGPLSPQQVEAIAVLRRAEARLEQLIENLIQFSLVSRGELSLNIQPVDLSALIQATVKPYLFKAREGGVTLELRLPDDLPPARCDKEKILWVIAQLLDNAIKFTPRGGRVGLEAYAKIGFVTVVVMDSGIGIPPERMEEIFEPFHQLDGSSTRRYAGTGLGLALSCRVLEAHGSRIGVDSVVTKGSRFEFSLPAVMI
jgi:signal transduction histidine kinase